MDDVVKLMKQKYLFYEADQLEGRKEKDITNLTNFKKVGIKTVYTSYNYTIDHGWDLERTDILRNLAWDDEQDFRECLLLVGSWLMEGDINKNVEKNEEIHRQASQLADSIGN